jgi:hypothetical protein
MPSDLATFKIPTPFASCFRTLRSIVLSIFGPAELHALGDSALEPCFDALANHRPFKFSERASDLSCRELSATSKMLLHRSGSRSKAAGCRIK